MKFLLPGIFLLFPAAANAKDGEFFERKIRPLLYKHCYECHSTETGPENGGLVLDSSKGLKAGGGRGKLFTPGKPQSSLLLRAVRYTDADLAMPPEGKLSKQDIAAMETWIAKGGTVPEYGTAAVGKRRVIDIAEGRKHWAFQPLATSPPPPVSNTKWPRRPWERFLLEKLEERQLSPSPPASRNVLLRRASFDVLGLPPSPEDVARFADDESPDAWPRAVDRLLASPHYGERWGRYWLDLARYTDTTASWLKGTGQSWLYRDWVVNAFNADVPYDRMVRLQLAADFQPDTPPNDIAALGFLGLSPTYWKELRLAPDVIRVVVAEEWDERIDAVSRTFLGLTVACARCHDHKFDPITTKDYYGLAGVFASTQLHDRPLLPPAEAQAVQAARAQVDTLREQLKKEKNKKSKAAQALQRKIDKLIAETPHYNLPSAHAVKEASVYVMPDGADKTRLEYRDEPRDLPVFRRGNPASHGDTVPRRFPEVLSSNEPRRFKSGSGREELADAILTESRSLAARVIVNRVWRHHFGEGLVRTPSNFGVQGERPSHPQLLDHLAAEFVRHDWSFKWLHREILLSAAYQQSSAYREDADTLYPENHLLWRMPRRRLDVEAYRDAMLSVAGNLDRRLGGAAVPIDDAGNNRRTIYAKVARRELHQMLRLYDFPEPTSHSPGRKPTTTPLQQLFVLNSEFVKHQASLLGARFSEEERIARMYRALFARLPTAEELEIGKTFIASAGQDAWKEYAHLLLGLNEFLFVD